MQIWFQIIESMLLLSL